jgi:Tol biopolymer transport system component
MMSLLTRTRVVAIALILAGYVFPTLLLQAQRLQPSTLVYLSNKDNTRRGFDIFLLQPDWQKPVNITKEHKDAGVTGASLPRLLAKRSTVLFFSTLSKVFKEIDLTTSKMRTVVTIAYESPQFDVSPDHRSFIYTERIDSSLQLVEVDLVTGSSTNRTKNRFNNTEPRYSPDGKTIAFVSDADGSRSIAVMNRDGSGQKILTNNFGDDHLPCFYPDGKRIVFTSSRSATMADECHIYGIDVSGENFSLLYDARLFNTQPQVLGDGFTVAFVSANRSKKTSHVLLKNVQTGVVIDITKELGGMCQNVSLSSDGRYLVCEHMTIADSEILCYEISTGTLRNLTNSKSWDCLPSF